MCSENKMRISFAVTVKLICVFVFAFADCCFSHDMAHFSFDLCWHVQVLNYSSNLGFFSHQDNLGEVWT